MLLRTPISTARTAQWRRSSTCWAPMADAKMACELDGSSTSEESEVKLSFEVYHRNHLHPPREWLQREIAVAGNR